MAQTPEGKVKSKLDKMLKTFEPELWFFSPQAGIYGKSGVPDRIACYFGNLIGIEVKAGDNRHPTDLQMATMTAITKAGGRCFIVYDGYTIERVSEYLTAMKTRERLQVNP
jgi:hypothetical protein